MSSSTTMKPLLHLLWHISNDYFSHLKVHRFSARVTHNVFRLPYSFYYFPSYCGCDTKDVTTKGLDLIIQAKPWRTMPSAPSMTWVRTLDLGLLNDVQHLGSSVLPLQDVTPIIPQIRRVLMLPGYFRPHCQVTGEMVWSQDIHIWSCWSSQSLTGEKHRLFAVQPLSAPCTHMVWSGAHLGKSSCH